MDFIYSSVISIFVISIITYILPNGKCRELIKWILSIIISFIMLNTILGMFNVSKSNEIQNDYLLTTANISEELDINTFKQYLTSLNISGAKINANASYNNNEKFYKIVEIDLKKAVINSDKSHIDILSDIEIIAKKIFGNNVKVIIYE